MSEKDYSKIWFGYALSTLINGGIGVSLPLITLYITKINWVLKTYEQLKINNEYFVNLELFLFYFKNLEFFFCSIVIEPSRAMLVNVQPCSHSLSGKYTALLYPPRP